MNASVAFRNTRWALLTGIALACLPLMSATASGQKASQVVANHMRWNNHDAVLAHAIAWQEERDGRWVTVVLLTDQPIAPAVVVNKTPHEIMEETKTQGVSFVVRTGGVPAPEFNFQVGYRDAGRIGTTTASGTGGFEIESQSTTRIKGRAVYRPFVVGEKDESAWSVSFDATVLRGDAKRMAAEGEALGPGGGPAGTDLLALQRAKLAMDYAALSAYASPELAALLQDAAARPKNLTMLKGMTAPQARVVGGLRSADRATIYWVQQWPSALDNRCVDTLVLKDGKWRSIESACQSE
ncbi:MAG: hypothetical protein ABI039_10610 [Vicinamibacterales bacterium]